MTHMNRDHARELSHLLRFHAHLGERAASSPSLRDISFARMVIRTPRAAGDHSVAFAPALASWDDIRPRLVVMDQAAREGLGLSDVYVTEYRVPRGLDGLVMGAVLFYYLCWFTLPLARPGTSVWKVLEAVFPGGPGFYRWLVRTIFVPVVGIHVVEAVLFDRYRMRRHGVERWSRLWWIWELDCLVEGYPCWARIDSVIENKRKQKETKSH